MKYSMKNLNELPIYFFSSHLSNRLSSVKADKLSENFVMEQGATL